MTTPDQTLRPTRAVEFDGIVLRPAEPVDSAFAFETKKAVLRDYAEKGPGWDEDVEQQRHRDRFAAQDFRIISFEGADVGILAVAVTPDCLKLNQLLLLPDYQRKRIGARCMAMVIAEGRLLGLPVQLRVMKANPRALSFYERLGFTVVDVTDHYVVMQLPLQESTTDTAP